MMSQAEIAALKRADAPRGDYFADALVLCDCTCSDFGEGARAAELLALAELMWRERMEEWDGLPSNRTCSRARFEDGKNDALDRTLSEAKRKIEGQQECRARFEAGKNDAIDRKLSEAKRKIEGQQE